MSFSERENERQTDRQIERKRGLMLETITLALVNL